MQDIYHMSLKYTKCSHSAVETGELVSRHNGRYRSCWEGGGAVRNLLKDTRAHVNKDKRLQGGLSQQNMSDLLHIEKKHGLAGGVMVEGT